MEGNDFFDRSFRMESILDLERHCYTPRHSTPTKDENETPNLQTTAFDEAISNPMIATKIEPAIGNYYSDERTPYTNQSQDMLQFSYNPREDSKTIGTVIPFAKKKYIRHSGKPPYSYVAMVIVAISSSDKKKLTLREIREKLMCMFPFFKGEYTGWKNSVRHALSKSNCFYMENNVFYTNASVWKVNSKFVTPHTFNRRSHGHDNGQFKLTLQEELGLPPYNFDVCDDTACKGGIKLPPKPCYQSEFGPLVGNTDDYLNGRNDIVPTPQSTVSDQDCVDIKQSRKRKCTEESRPAQTTTHPKQVSMPPVVVNDPMYYGQYVQPSESFRPYDSSLNCYTSNFTTAQQVPQDSYYHGYPQQQTSYAQPWNYWSYNDDILRYWWNRESMYHGMGTSSSQPTYYSYTNGWFSNDSGIAESPLNLTKSSGHKN